MKVTPFELSVFNIVVEGLIPSVASPENHPDKNKPENVSDAASAIAIVAIFHRVPRNNPVPPGIFVPILLSECENINLAFRFLLLGRKLFSSRLSTFRAGNNSHFIASGWIH